MRFGTFHLIGAPEMQPGEQRIGETVDQIVLAEELGLHQAWVAEHHFSNYGYATNPLLIIAKAAGLTKRIRFGQAIIVTPFWHPLRLAEDIALTDILTDGRLDVGIGRGYQKMEFDGFDLKLEDSRATFLEQMEIMQKAWTEDDFTHQGQFFTIPRPITMLPKPLQKPHPQIWVACQSDQTVDWTAEQGYLPLFSGSPCSREQIEGWRARFLAGWRAAGHRRSGPAHGRPAVRLRLRQRGGSSGRPLADALAAPGGRPSEEQSRADRRRPERAVSSRPPNRATTSGGTGWSTGRPSAASRRSSATPTSGSASSSAGSTSAGCRWRRWSARCAGSPPR